LELGQYDRTRKLIIDPTVIFATAVPMPAGDNSLATDLAADTTGNAYLLNETNFQIFTTNLGGQFLGPADCTVTKFNPDGTAVLYQTTVKVQGTCGKLTVDANGNAFFSCLGTVTPTPGVVQSIDRGHDPAFIKLSPTGQVLFATFFGGSGGENINRITTDSSGNLIVTGATNSNDFPLVNPIQSTPFVTSFSQNEVIFSINASGTAVNFSTFFGISSVDSVAADASNNVYLTIAVEPQFVSGFFPVKNPVNATCGTGQLVCSLLAKFTSNGSLAFSGFVSPTPDTFQAMAIAADHLGTVYLAGENGFQQGIQFLGNLLISRVDPATGALSPITLPAITFFATPNSFSATQDDLFPIGVDAANNLYVIAPPTPNGPQDQIISVSPAGTTNFSAPLPAGFSQASGVFAQRGFAAGAAGRFFWIGPTFLVNALQTFPTPGATVLTTLAGFSDSSTPSLGYRPGQLTFGQVPVGLQSQTPQEVDLTNYGLDPLTIANISTSSDFSQTNTCSVPPVDIRVQCVIFVNFNPTAVGPRTGTLTITSNARDPVVTIPLSGTGTPALVPGLAISPTSLSLGDTPVNGNSTPQSVTLTSNGTGPVNFARVDTTGDFIEKNTCGISLAAGAQCTISVILHPTVAGTRTGTVVISDNVAGSPQTINLTGNGIAGFFIASQSSNPTITVAAGQSGSMQLNLGSSLGFAGPVNLSCSGAPANSTCSVSPSSVQLAANGSTPIAISVTTAARATAGLPPRGGTPWPGSSTLVAASLLGLMLWSLFTGNSRRLAFAGAALFALALAGCGGGGSTPPPPPTVIGTPAGTYTITVTGTSGTITQSQAVTLNVN
jgi:hypothetical protein